MSEEQTADGKPSPTTENESKKGENSPNSITNINNYYYYYGNSKANVGDSSNGECRNMVENGGIGRKLIRFYTLIDDHSSTRLTQVSFLQLILAIVRQFHIY